MRFIWLVFLGLVALLLGLFGWQQRGAAPAATVPPVMARTAALRVARPTTGDPATVIPFRTGLADRASPAEPAAADLTGPAPSSPRRDSVVRSALQLLGTSYCYAGTTPAGGFDCSGFVKYVFSLFQVPLPHSTALLIDVGRPVPRAEARPGDVVVFTGTAKTSTTPGHAGIVVTAGPGGPLRFVHSSSARHESGVKISQVEGSDYERRFMQVRRVLPE